MPFIVGVHTPSLVALESMPLEETIFVDLDNDKVVGGEDDYDILPSSLLTMIRSTIKQSISSSKSNLFPFFNPDSKFSFSNFFRNWSLENFRSCRRIFKFLGNYF